MALTLNGSTGISGIAGSAGTPALQGNNDANTGYFFAADTLGLSTAGSERLRIDSSGNLGLGTASPTDTGGYGRALDITGGASGAAIYLRSANGDTGQIALGSADLTIRTRQADPIIFNTNNAERLRIDSGGRILIGSTQLLDSTVGTLHIDGGTSGGRIVLRGTTTSAGGGIAEIFSYWNTNKVAGIIALAGHDANNKDNGHLTFYTRPDLATGVQERVRIDSSGRVLIGTTTEGHVQGNDLTLANTGHCGISIRSGTSSYGNIFFSDGTSGNDEIRGSIQYDHANNKFYFATNTTTALVIDSSQNVGIGTNSPTNGFLEVKNTSYNGGSTGFLTLEGGGESGVMFKTSSYGNDQHKIGTNNHGHMFFRVAAGTRASLTSNGLCFNSDTAAANALSDYEEGDFTLHFAVEGYSNASMSGRYGFYRKIGDIVHVWGGGTVANTYGSAASNRAFEFKNLPFTPKDASGASNPGYVTGVFNYSGLSSTGISNMSGTAPYSFRPRLFNGNTHGRIEAYRSDSDQGSVNASLAFPANCSVGLYLCYSI